MKFEVFFLADRFVVVNGVTGCYSTIFPTHLLVIFVYKLSQNEGKCQQTTSSDILLCPQPGDVQFSVLKENIKQKTFRFTKLEFTFSAHTDFHPSFSNVSSFLLYRIFPAALAVLPSAFDQSLGFVPLSCSFELPSVSLSLSSPSPSSPVDPAGSSINSKGLSGCVCVCVCVCVCRWLDCVCEVLGLYVPPCMCGCAVWSKWPPGSPGSHLNCAHREPSHD